jgi:hypothetical protein
MVGSLVPLGVQPQCQQICAEVIRENPNKVRNVHGYHTIPDHNNRKCVDYMIYDTAGGERIANYHLASRDRLLVDLMIWNRRIIRSYDKPGIPAWTWAPYTGKSPHTDHPHVQYKVGKYVPPDGGTVVDKPKNEEGIKAGDKVKVNATGGLKGRATPGGAVNLVRPDGFEFTVKDVKDGWASGGENWYSTDYLDKVVVPNTPVPPKPVPPKPAAKPSWSSKPIVTLAISKIPGDVTYLQAVCKVAGGVVNGKKVADIYVLAQDPGAKGDTRFLAFNSGGGYINSMTVKNGGHGSTFHAYRSAAGNLYIWTLIGSTAYRIKWQPGKTVTSSSSGVEKMAYGTARPVGTYEHYVGFRAANDTHETFTIHDRFGFTDPKNNTSRPIRKVTVKKRTDYTQQTWSVSDTRIYRFMGKTNTDAPKGTRKHILDVFDWAGKLLLDRFDLTAMAVPTTSDEPEGLTFTGTPGSVLAGKREGGSKPNRSYPIWQLTGLP